MKDFYEFQVEKIFLSRKPKENFFNKIPKTNLKSMD
jgi:hypothetical protein